MTVRILTGNVGLPDQRGQPTGKVTVEVLHARPRTFIHLVVLTHAGASRRCHRHDIGHPKHPDGDEEPYHAQSWSVTCLPAVFDRDGGSGRLTARPPSTRQKLEELQTRLCHLIPSRTMWSEDGRDHAQPRAHTHRRQAQRRDGMEVSLSSPESSPGTIHGSAGGTAVRCVLTFNC